MKGLFLLTVFLGLVSAIVVQKGQTALNVQEELAIKKEMATFQQELAKDLHEEHVIAKLEAQEATHKTPSLDTDLAKALADVKREVKKDDMVESKIVREIATNSAAVSKNLKNKFKNLEAEARKLSLEFAHELVADKQVVLLRQMTTTPLVLLLLMPLLLLTPTSLF